MKSQACEPCAKRKVRCDREEPCSNCKRRKQDQCIYPETSPYDRIKKLEILVRSLGGDPESEDIQTVAKPQPRFQNGIQSHSQSRDAPTVDQKRSGDPMILEEDGQRYYVDSRSWNGWLGYSGSSVRGDAIPTRASPGSILANALQGILCSRSPIDLTSRLPPKHVAVALFETYKQRVDPLARITFDWELKRLHTASIESQTTLNDAEIAFLLALYLISVQSLTDVECTQRFNQPKMSLLTDLQQSVEEALSQTNVLCIKDILVIKALVLYMMAVADRVSTQSLWSLMGLVSRNAERLGLHRDGILLELPPVEVEDRRRVWWQLQHIDLGLAVRTGLTPMTLMADWDVKIPSNLEDEDINTSMTEAPKERKGLTSMSYCRLTHWIVRQQREFFLSSKSRFELAWQVNQALMPSLRMSLCDQIEEGLNQNFLQYCDPIKPLHTLMQLLARTLVCGLRLRILHATTVTSREKQKVKESDRSDIFQSCVRSIEYSIALWSQPSIKMFLWWTKSWFQWQALMYVLVEASQNPNESCVLEIWQLLEIAYATCSLLTQLSEDRRAAYAATHVVSAWKACRDKFCTSTSMSVSTSAFAMKPEFVSRLETLLAEHHAKNPHAQQRGTKRPRDESENDAGRDIESGTGSGSGHGHGHGREGEPITPESFLGTESGSGPAYEDEVDYATFTLNFDDIDWSFWSSMDQIV